MRKTVTIIGCSLALSVCGMAVGASPILVTLDAECAGGLHEQPQGVFSVLAFCDDALGNNIGVALVNFDGPFDTKKWGPTNRFWQNDDWAGDVTSFAWAPSGRFLFVATGSVYGTGTVYRLDLGNKTYESVFGFQDLDPDLVARESAGLEAETYDAIIESLDEAKRTITLAIRLWYGDGETKVIGRRTLLLGNIE